MLDFGLHWLSWSSDNNHWWMPAEKERERKSNQHKMLMAKFPSFFVMPHFTTSLASISLNLDFKSERDHVEALELHAERALENNCVDISCALNDVGQTEQCKLLPVLLQIESKI